MKNYRPVSNLPYIAKISEKIVLNQVDNHMILNSLHQDTQSAYRANHSTETALLKIHNDLLLAMDDKKCTLLVLLDMSAAFDTVEHCILLNRLRDTFRITGTANAWLASYFTDRTQRVNITGTLSDPCPITCGMPQGSILGPKGYPMYVSPVFKIAEKHSVSMHMYADDTQLYVSFSPSEWHSAKRRMEECIREIREWLNCNCLKLNDGKTELMVLGQSSLVSKIEGNLEIFIGNTVVKTSLKVRNIGAIFDSEMKMQDQVNSVCRSSYACLHSIGRIRRYLDETSVKALVHAFITCRIDNLNSLLAGIPDYVLDKLQMVLHNAARLITRLDRKDHITDTLIELHWLPIAARIDYKILVLTYKALNDLGPSYLLDLLPLKQHKRNTRSSEDFLMLQLPTTHFKTLGDRSFRFYAVKEWNVLPLELRDSPSLSVFKKDLKTFLFRRSYPGAP